MALIIILALAAVCIAASWLVSSAVVRSAVIAAGFLVAWAVSLILSREGRALPADEASAGFSAQSLEGQQATVPSPEPDLALPDRSVWEEWKKSWEEADLLLQKAPRPESFSEAWTSFGQSIERLESNSKSIFDNSKKAFDISDNLAGTAEKAFALSEQVQAKVRELTGELGASLEETRRLYDESKKIVGILEMMSEISSKTYVLSINASVVATRAGAHGRAFDVVAKEIRKLAQETENSLKNIEDFVTHIQEIVRKVVEHTTVTSGEIEKEKDSLLSVAGALQGVILAVEIIRTVSNLSKEKASEQQTISKDIIAKTRELAGRIQAEASSNQVDAIQQKIRRLRQILDHY